MSHAIDLSDHKTTLAYVKRILGIPDDIKQAPFVYQHSPLSKGNHLYYQGDPAGDVYILLEGTMKAYRVSHEGEECIVRFIFPGEVLWTSGFNTHHRSTSVVALEESSLVSLPDTTLARLMSEHTCVQQRCFRMLSKIIKNEQTFIHLLANAHAEKRVAYFLLHIWKHQSSREGAPFEIRIPMTRLEIGRYLGLSEETVSRIFSRLQAQRIIAVNHPVVDLLDLNQMETIANSESTIEQTS